MVGYKSDPRNKSLSEKKNYESPYVVSSYDDRTSHLEYNWIDVLSEKVEKEPVSNIAFAYDGFDAFFFDSPKIWKVIHILYNSIFYLYLSLRTNALM